MENTVATNSYDCSISTRLTEVVILFKENAYTACRKTKTNVRKMEIQAFHCSTMFIREGNEIIRKRIRVDGVDLIISFIRITRFIFLIITSDLKLK